MSQEIDYQSDVQNLKQVWGNTNKDTKYKQTTHQPNPKNLQTIQSTGKRQSKNKSTIKPLQQKKPQNKNYSKCKQTQKIKDKKQSIKNSKSTVFCESNVKSKSALRNPRHPNPDQVIQVNTKPNKFSNERIQNSKSHLIKSHIIINDPNSCHDFQNQTWTSNKFTPSSNPTNTYDLKKQIQQKDYQLSLLRITNNKNQDRIRYLQSELNKRDQIIHQMKIKERKYISKNCELESKQFNFDYGKVQYQNYKNDSKRLLKMLQSTAQYKTFAQLALNDQGVRFLHHVNKNQKSKIDNPRSQSTTMVHFCSCNKAFIPESSFWVPQKVYSFGRQFIKNRSGQPISQSQVQLMLYELNKIWRQRQKVIINSLNALKGHQVSKYKRKIQNMNVTSRQRTKKSVSMINNGKNHKKQQNYSQPQQNQGIQQ